MSTKTAPAKAQPAKAKPRRRLTVLAQLPERPFRLRLIDAVTMAAVGLLVLKLVAMIGDGASSAPPLPDFARAIANARTDYELPDPTTTGSITPKDKPAEAAKPAEPPVYQPAVKEPVSPTERAILEKLANRRDTLKQRADELDLREKMLGEAEKKLETGVSTLQQAEDKADLGGTKKAEAERAGLKSIVTMYETMKPKDAARVFDRLGLDVLVPIVLAMNPRKMAEVLAVMGAEPAEKLTVALANRARGIDGTPTQQANAGGLPANELPALDPGQPAR
ncbi:MotE family protein [Methylobacterium brachythecii]|uniref:Flagellar motility protein MotE (MotC chaperone) n=1 Tax=Methylobacterium brachythecii TaxID=1176177 RepID=A0A7W6F5W7_9HYPH|nr:hypothetical protein [Methylobacterium brachythecii]MBB3901777.1 flagellar motility protein MotE (MotC chaperone) [Methylobacterium brachythecii]GLS47071.1 hypothetical protein GCM10007884_50730 [Methylobacterium brachythecii]